jgi:D-arabinose 1-dehydrogenase-like Zn-dependent alcohol dehydrogenase
MRRRKANQSTAIFAKTGRVPVIVGRYCFRTARHLSPDLLRRQVTLVGSWTFSKQGQAECAEFIAERKVARPSSCRPDVSA